MFGWRLPGMLMACVTTLLSSQAKSADELIDLKPGQKIAAFQAECTYESETGRAIGARFRHISSGFVLDLLRIQSLPQAFMWVNSFPPSDMGEPHTCEHLMLGKGTKGRYVGSLEEMSLGNSSAFTAQLQTCYHFHTAAGPDVFFELMEAKLEALIHPDFSDEEIRREVCNMGYTIDPVDSSMRLEEKGTVYSEMLSSFERPWGNLGRKLGHLLYGHDHPLSNESGGYPDAIRQMTPDDMRKFIAQNYHVSNMGMIVSISDDIALEDCLSKISGILARVEPDARAMADPAAADEALPPPRSAAPGTIELVGFPAQNEKEPGLLLFAWPPVQNFDNREAFLLELLMGNLASGETSILFRKFIDSQTRIMNIGANAVFEWVGAELGHPVYVGFNNMRKEACSKVVIDSMRGLILEEINAIAALPDGSPELEAFNERAQNRIVERRRDLRNFLNSPPGFGYRGTGDRWLEHLKHLRKTSGFNKRLTLDEELLFTEENLKSGKNFWRDYIAKWKLLKYKPYAVASCPDPYLLSNIEKERDTRVAAFVAGLQDKYKTHTPEEAIGRFKSEYDSQTAIIDSVANGIAMPKFISNPPLTLDDLLQYHVTKLPGGGQMVASTFENMTSSTVGLSFNMNVLPESLLLYAAAIPFCLTEVGVTKDGRQYPYDEMKEALRHDIMDLRSYYSISYRNNRVELTMRVSGGNLDESQEAMKWLDAVLFSPTWTEENLPRLRDAVFLALSDIHNTMRGSEESWVDDPANSYWRQGNPLLLNANCFLTQAHALHRLRWMLKEADSEVIAKGFSLFMQDLAAYGEQATREELGNALDALAGDALHVENASVELENLLAIYQALPTPTSALALDAIQDLKHNLSAIPDATMYRDWRYLCRQMDADLKVSPRDVLRELKHVMGLILRRDNVRAFVIGNSADQKALRPAIDKILERLSEKPSEHQAYDKTPRVISRLRERFPDLSRPVFVGLINENTRQGVFINSAPCASFHDTDPDTLLKFLSARLYGGGGAHSMFMKTWSAGLAYSNGLRSNEFTGRLIYYAERCPDLAQTMQFVVGELRRAPRDPALAEYAVAQAFGVYRSGSRYEARGEAMAADLADGLTPEIVKRFRSKIQALRQDPKLAEKLYDLMENTYGEVLPGYGATADSVEDAVYYIIGPESQFRSYEDYLHSVEGDFPLFRLYPRDYWLIRELPEEENNLP